MSSINSIIAYHTPFLTQETADCLEKLLFCNQWLVSSFTWIWEDDPSTKTGGVRWVETHCVTRSWQSFSRDVVHFLTQDCSSNLSKLSDSLKFALLQDFAWYASRISWDPCDDIYLQTIMIIQMCI